MPPILEKADATPIVVFLTSVGDISAVNMYTVENPPVIAHFASITTTVVRIGETKNVILLLIFLLASLAFHSSNNST